MGGSTSWRALKCKMAEAEQQRQQPSTGEEEPLLGGVGDATQQQRPIYHNFVLGTGVVAQAGAWILAAIVWGSVFSHDLILFSVHPLLNSAAVAGLVVIEYNKIDHGGTHFESPHAILGLVTYILIALQAIVGITQYFTPGLYGGVDNAKALYKYHRVGGYITLLLMLATVCAATQTTFNTNVLQMQLWAVVVASVIIVVGVGARIKRSKFGWMAGK